VKGSRVSSIGRPDRRGSISAKGTWAKEGPLIQSCHHCLLSGRGCSAPPATKTTLGRRCAALRHITIVPLVVSASFTFPPSRGIAPDSPACRQRAIRTLCSSASLHRSPELSLPTYLTRSSGSRPGAGWSGFAGPRHHPGGALTGAALPLNFSRDAGLSPGLRPGLYGREPPGQRPRTPGVSRWRPYPTRPARHGTRSRKDVRRDPRPGYRLLPGRSPGRSQPNALGPAQRRFR